MQQNNSIEQIKELIFKRVGSSWLYDSLYLFLITPIGIISSLLNAISLIIFFKKEFRSIKIYKYYQVYTFNNLLISSILSCFFFFTPRYLFTTSLSYNGRIFKCLVIPSYGMALFFFYGNAMGILLNMERASNYCNKYKHFKQTQPYVYCLILFIICFIINMPTCILIKMATDEDIQYALTSIDNAKLFKGICLRNPISLTILGKIVTIFGYAVKGLLTLCFDIGSNLLSMIAYKQFINAKMRTLNPTAANDTQTKMIELKKKKQTFMTFYLTVFSIFVHSVEFAADIIIFFYSSDPRYLFGFSFFIIFVIALKQTVNFVFFYVFNKNFRNCFKNLFSFKK